MSIYTTAAPVALYRFFDAAGALLYVGITTNPGARWGQHRSRKSWWSEVAQITLETHPSARDAVRAEKVAIQTELPRYNVAHHPTRGNVLPRCPQTEPRKGRYLGSAEVADFLGVSRQRVQQLAVNAGFPPPIAKLGLGRVWKTEDIIAWARARGREIVEEA